MAIIVELDAIGSRILLTFPYSEDNTECAKLIRERHWINKDKAWSYPLRMDVCLDLRRIWGERLVVGPRLAAWARAHRADGMRLKRLGSAEDAPLRRVAAQSPVMWEAMSYRTYQRAGAAFMALGRNTANLDDPGLGKTLQSLAALIEAGKENGRHLVIVNSKTAIRSTWAHEIKKWFPTAKVYPMPDGYAARQQNVANFMADKEGPRFLIVIPHMLQMRYEHYCKKCKMWNVGDAQFPQLHWAAAHAFTRMEYTVEWPEILQIEWDSVIADECHKYLLKLRPPSGKTPQPQWAHGMRKLRLAPDGLRMAMTGTPFRGHEENIFGILHWLEPKKFSSFWDWAGRYFEIVPGYSERSQVITQLQPEKEKAFYEMLDEHSIRRSKYEVRGDLPENSIIEHWVPLHGKHKAQYNKMKKEGLAVLDSGVLEPAGVLAELTRLRQLAFGAWDIQYEDLYTDDSLLPVRSREILTPLMNYSPKVDALLEQLEERGAFEGSGKKFIVASQYVTILNALKDHIFKLYKVHCLEIHGGISSRGRDGAVYSFRYEPEGPRILLLNTIAGGTSLTLDEMCDEMFILDETWVHDDQKQLMGRIDNRGSAVRPRTFHYFRTEGTIDERVSILNDAQNQMESKILDQRRGVDFAISLIGRK